MSEQELTCRQLIEFIGDFLDGTLPEEQLRRFEAHLAICPDCVTYLDGYQKGVALQARAFDRDSPVPDGVPQDLVRAILDVRRRRSPETECAR